MFKSLHGTRAGGSQKESYSQCRVMSDLLDPSGGDDAIQSWRIFRIMSEFVDGFALLRRYGLAATFFGSARFPEDHPMYKASQELAGLLAHDGFTIITGGGGGVMEAANLGAYTAGGKSVGLNIELPTEQQLNAHTNDAKKFHFFFTRKVMLSFASEVYIYFPGGFGTLDEFFEIVTLVQTKKITKIPIILYGKEYWAPLLEWINTVIYEKYEAIHQEDMDLYHVVDSVEEAHAVILEHVDRATPRQV